MILWLLPRWESTGLQSSVATSWTIRSAAATFIRSTVRTRPGRSTRTWESRTRRVSNRDLVFDPHAPMTTKELTLRLKAEANRLGFDRVGIAPAVSPPGYGRLLEWLQADHAAGMTYMQGQLQARQHPDHLLEGVRSVVMASVVYGQPAVGGSAPHEGKIARYAQGPDYHRVLWDRLDALLDW